MEEAELLKERLQAITNKRKVQEDIVQRRLKTEEEKLKLHHLKKKALREKWLLDGLSTLTPEEKEDILRQNQEDQQQIKHLECVISRLEKEIDDLEKEELQLSAKEVRVLQRLKSVERTTEDIIKALKTEVQEEPVRDIYDGIPDLPMSYVPTFVKKMETTKQENGEEPRKALFAMEIKVEKDMKTGTNTVLSTIPVPSSKFQDTGVKVYDDGRKSVHAVNADGTVTKNGVDTLAPVEVEDLLRKATQKSTESPTEYHEPVYSNPYCSSSTQKGQVSPRLNGYKPQIGENYENGYCLNGKLSEETQLSPINLREVTPINGSYSKEPRVSPTPQIIMTQRGQPFEEHTEHQLKTMDSHHETTFVNSGECATDPSGFEDDVHYNIVHATPCFVDDSEPVTMIFMGYKHADESENKPISDYEGVIRAELVVIDDDDDNEEADKKGGETTMTELSSPPVIHQNQISKPSSSNNATQNLASRNITLNSEVPYKNSISLQEQETSLGYHNYPLPSRPISNDGTEDPSLTALRIRMAKLGKKVI
ncbi:palmdelphin [Rhinophrynus dorsalis]